MDRLSSPEKPESEAGMGGVISGAARGIVGAMAMTGMRVTTTELGLVDQTSVQALGRQRARGIRALLWRAPRKRRRGMIELPIGPSALVAARHSGRCHASWRSHPWAGPVYRLVVCLGFELGIAPVLDVS
jgi:hypothetical protein